MASKKIKSKITINDLLTGIKQLSDQELGKATKELLKLGVTQRITQPPKLETQLLKQINKKLSKTKQSKYEQLTKKRLAKKMTKKEQNQLKTLIDALEKIEIERIQAIYTLAEIKGISPDELMKI